MSGGEIPGIPLQIIIYRTFILLLLPEALSYSIVIYFFCLSRSILSSGRTPYYNRHGWRFFHSQCWSATKLSIICLVIFETDSCSLIVQLNRISHASFNKRRMMVRWWLFARLQHCAFVVLTNFLWSCKSPQGITINNQNWNVHCSESDWWSNNFFVCSLTFNDGMSRPHRGFTANIVKTWHIRSMIINNKSMNKILS